MYVHFLKFCVVLMFASLSLPFLLYYITAACRSVREVLHSDAAGQDLHRPPLKQLKTITSPIIQQRDNQLSVWQSK